MSSARSGVGWRFGVAGLVLVLLVLPDGTSAARRSQPTLEIRGTLPVFKGGTEVFHVTVWNRQQTAARATITVLTPASMPIIQTLVGGKRVRVSTGAHHRLVFTILNLAPGGNRDSLIVFLVQGPVGSRPCVTARAVVGDARPAKTQLCTRVAAH
jgi:hypothetical protein